MERPVRRLKLADSLELTSRIFEGLRLLIMTSRILPYRAHCLRQSMIAGVAHIGVSVRR
jgi:hypothetical protein